MLEDSLAWIRIRYNLFGCGSAVENITSYECCGGGAERAEIKLLSELKLRIAAPAPFYLSQT
jgi:hypothetical protein